MDVYRCTACFYRKWKELMAVTAYLVIYLKTTNFLGVASERGREEVIDSISRCSAAPPKLPHPCLYPSQPCPLSTRIVKS